MASSNTEIANLALSHLSSGKEISNLETDRSQEALACRRFFETARDAVLRDFAWPFATKIADLGLVEETPSDEWDYSYRYPTDCVKLRRVLSGTRNDTRDSRVPYKLISDDAGSLIYVDTENAQCEYTARITDPGRYPPDFVMAMSCRLAAYIAPRITAGDPFKLGKRAMDLYEYELGLAKASAMNEEQAEEDPDSEFIRARE